MTSLALDQQTGSSESSPRRWVNPRQPPINVVTLAAT